jgi:hypothetical protein
MPGSLKRVSSDVEGSGMAGPFSRPLVDDQLIDRR